jgi:hypothetical protein
MNGVRHNIRSSKKGRIFINLTHLFSIPVVFAAISRQSKCAGEARVD